MPAPRRLAIHWFRRDLRVADNTALLHAARRAAQVLPVYVVSDWRRRHPWTAAGRQQFLCGALASLAANLAALGGRLVIRCGRPVDELTRLLDECRADLVTFNRDPDPSGREQQRRLERRCRERGIETTACDDVALHPPDEVLTAQGRPFRVFTPFCNAWLARAKPAPLGKPRTLHTPAGIASLPLPTLAHWGLAAPPAGAPESGERAARKRLERAAARVLPSYAALRDVPAADATSRLSQDLRWGLLSPRTVHAAAARALARAPTAAAAAGARAFIRELAWREFYLALLAHFPEVLETEFQPQWRGLPWLQPDARFAAWTDGRTGFPLVDAGMRQLAATGFMHNRLRMITAMFLTKDLHLDWRLGEQFFIRHLIDGEIASNNGGWQWSAGTGADAAPYFRIQNPWAQSARHDPDGAFIRRWVPELHAVPAPALHAPPPPGRTLAAGYPPPVVDHAAERDRTLALFNRHRRHQR